MINVVREKNYDSSGQILLIVIITMVVTLTVGLTFASRAITNLRISKQNEDSQRAFQAASAGVEKYLQTPCPAGTTCSNNLSNATFNTSVTKLEGNQILLNNGQTVDQDRGIDLWLSNYPDFTIPVTGILTLAWGTSDQTFCTVGSSGSTMPAIEIVLLSGSSSSPTVSKYVYDSCASRRSSNNFSAPSSGPVTISGINFSNSSQVGVNTGLVSKIIPLYNSAVIGVTFNPSVFGQTLPAQGKIIVSTGSSGDVTRKLLYFESYPQIPNEVFPYVVLSQ